MRGAHERNAPKHRFDIPILVPAFLLPREDGLERVGLLRSRVELAALYPLTALARGIGPRFPQPPQRGSREADPCRTAREPREQGSRRVPLAARRASRSPPSARTLGFVMSTPDGLAALRSEISVLRPREIVVGSGYDVAAVIPEIAP